MKSLGLILAALATAPAYGSYNFNQRTAVQGYLKAGSTAVPTGSYAMKFIIKNAGNAVWSKTYTGGSKVTVTDGMFSQILSGTDDSAVALNANLLDVSASTDAITIDVVVDLDNNGIGTGTDSTFSNLDIVPAPMALFSKIATNLTQNGATNGQYLAWNGSSSRWEPSTFSASSLGAGAIDSTLLADGSVDTAKLTDTAVTSAKLADAAVTSSKISDGSVSSAKLVDASVTSLKLADGSISTAKLAASAVDSSKLATDSVTTIKIVDGSITAAKLAASAVGASQLASGAVNLAGASVTGTLPATAGGSGQSTYAAGDILYATSTTALSRLPAGSAGQVLTVSSGVPAWQTPVTVSSTNTWTGVNQFNGGVGAGTTITGGANIAQMKVCSGSVGAFNVATAGTGITNTLSCAGVTTAMAVECSPTGNPTQANTPWWNAYVSATNTISIRVTSTGTSGTEMAAATWRCLVFQ